MVAILDKGEGARPSSSKRQTYGRKLPRYFPVLPPFSCGMKKVIACLELCVKDQVICLPKLNYIPSLGDHKTARVLLLSSKEGAYAHLVCIFEGLSGEAQGRRDTAPKGAPGGGAISINEMPLTKTRQR